MATDPVAELLDLPADYGRPEVPLEWGDVRARSGGRYEPQEPFGRGGMGVVFLARHVALDRLVAVKKFDVIGDVRDPSLAQRFVCEARTRTPAFGVVASVWPVQRPTTGMDDLQARRPVRQGRSQSQTNASARRLPGQTLRARPREERAQIGPS
jgi:hypothetical protein